jgi:hypothetical protein
MESDTYPGRLLNAERLPSEEIPTNYHPSSPSLQSEEKIYTKVINQERSLLSALFDNGP